MAQPPPVNPRAAFGVAFECSECKAPADVPCSERPRCPARDGFPDPELGALLICLRALAPLEPDARFRALDYVARRLSIAKG